ncbi:MAG: hypothetical protein Q4P78_05520 [Rothia sp. (in: high G+C Gram-positive bacteria)]|uniref:hypothetical protein n=1 Tax=Rothia sp. (in: high G+C Gram-positive bacteria) TaxID=1885016 RepID=UPI0026E0F764|nr:hypothetical protein [Rothia sp. (in: high G+C Gram-positive bacteria)]MDO5750646.1 hypothetical protein [Rothia sp. (in: high G+C Gram-positive bacteria)]
MTEPRIELTRLLDALSAHLTAVENRRGEQDPAVDEAYVAIANAFEAYEDALFDTYHEVTPLDVFIEDEDDEDEEFFPEDDEEDDDDIEYVD